MIPIDHEFKVVAHIHIQITDTLDKIQDAEVGNNRFSDPSPNWLTRERLTEILEELEFSLIELGAVRIVAHGHCDQEHHWERAVWATGNWVYLFEDGRTDYDLVQKGQLILDGLIMETCTDDLGYYQDYLKVKCPCSPASQSQPEHQVAKYFAWPFKPESRIKDIAGVMVEIHHAISMADDNKRRSGIREQLLNIIIILERLMVDETAKEISARRIPSN